MDNNDNEDEKKEETENEPKIYGDYEILKPIGRGKFAVVYRARRISDGSIVALKRISVDMIDEKARDKCLKEVRLLQSLDHPNIIKYYDSFINETDHLIIIVEWAAAGDLKRQLRKAQEKQVGFEERIIWKYFSQIADAMQHMHERRIMHRDLKPANILLTLDGTVKVGDLGLSRELSENTYQAHSKVGTPLYMSPEVLRGDGYDFKSDIWSIGCLLYELAMLKSPFKSEGLNMFSLFQKISQGEYSPLPDRYSEELRNLAYAMISTNPTDRPDIADICEISRNMRLKCNEEYAKEKKNQSSLKSQMAPNAEAIQDRQPSINGSRQPLSSNQEEHSDENREENWQNSGRNSARDAKRSSSPRDLPPKTAGRSDSHRVAAGPVRGSFGADSDDSDATHDLKSNKIKANSNTPLNDSPEKEERSPVDNLKHRDHQSNNSTQQRSARGGNASSSNGREPSEYTQPERRRSSNTPPQKPNFPPRSHPEERDEAYIPYTSLPSHDQQPPLRQPTQSGQPSHRRVKEKTNDLEHPKRDMNVHRTHDFNTPSSNEQNSKKSTVLESIGGTLAVMDQIYSKLSILGYPVSSDPTEDPTSNHSQCRISSLHFVCELSLLYGNRNRISFPSTQFGTFVEVSLWLMEQSSTKPFVPGIDIDHDAPPMIAKRLLNLAQECGIPPSVVAEINPSSLVQGYGDNTCLFLNLLADTAMKSRNHRWQQFVYPEEPLSHSPEQPLEPEIDDFAEEDVEDLQTDRHLLEGEVSSSDQSSANLHRSFIFPTFDSVRWKEETERVAPSLRASMKEKSRGALGWTSNIETLSRYASQANHSENGTEEAVDISTVSLVEMVSMLQRNLLDGLSGISRGESLMNSNDALSSLAVEYAGLHEKLRVLEESQKEYTKSVSANSNRLGEIQDNLQEALDELASKTGDDASGEGNSALLKLKQAIKSLKDENRDLHLRTGLLHNEILNIRKAVTSEKALSRKNQNRNRKKRPNGTASG